ncbi:MAG: hydrogenase nickel incorporation protein HypB [Vulcanimicrobiaceae bacterium]
MKLRVVEIQQSILRRNDDLACALRERFGRSGTLVVNLLSSPGSGKTTLVEATLRHFAPACRVGALVGDQATRNDAIRLERSGAPVRQITTAAECRLDADMIGKALAGWEALPLDMLLIENVGNLICPAEYDLGEDLRVALCSVTEGEDKPLKYPLAFNSSAVTLLSKMDLADATGFDRAAAYEALRSVHPAATVLEISAKTGAGMVAWFDVVAARLARKREGAFVT